MSFSQTEVGKTLAQSFSRAQDLKKLQAFSKSLRNPNFIHALHDIVNIQAQRDRDIPRSKDKTRDEDFWAAFTQPGFMSELCDPDNVRKDEIKCLIGLIKSSSSSKEDIRKEKKRLEPFTPEERDLIAKARAAKRNSGFSISVADIIRDYWLPLVLWKKNRGEIAATLNGLKTEGVFGVGTVSNIDYMAVKTALTRLGLDAPS